MQVTPSALTLRVSRSHSRSQFVNVPNSELHEDEVRKMQEHGEYDAEGTNAEQR